MIELILYTFHALLSEAPRDGAGQWEMGLVFAAVGAIGGFVIASLLTRR